jgi:uncharacterized membrane protein YczE
MKSYLKRLIRLIFGLFLFALGTYFSIQANIGLAPWDAFSIGVSEKTGILYGNVVVLTGLVILVIDLLLKEKIGIGTILNTLLIGKFTDFLRWLNWLPQMHSFLPGVVMLLAGQVILCFGSYFYISAALGCGPRDALMIAFGKRLRRAPIGLVRGLLEGSALLIGWLLGAKVGVGTVISVFGIGLILQMTFRIMRFEVKELSHESLLDTAKRLREHTK